MIFQHFFVRGKDSEAFLPLHQVRKPSRQGGCHAACLLDGGGVALFRPASLVRPPRDQACVGCHPLVRNFAPEPHAIHGVGWQRPWQLLEDGETFALMSFEHRPDPSWPFAFDCSQAFRLGPDALELTLSGTNQSDQPAPFGLGWHPYFVKRPHGHLRFRAGGRWEMGADNLPTHHTPGTGLDAPTASLAIDHCYDGWHGEALLRDARMSVRITSSLDHLVVYTNSARDFVAIEPVSHVNNAVNMAQGDPERQRRFGVCILQPGESLSASMRIETGPTT